jgi:uncharacterized protein YbaA (DUF1428 family)
MKPTYIDAYVLVIKKDKVAAYRKMAEDGCNMWVKHGALSYRECMGDDIEPKSEGGISPLGFPALTQLQDDETVWFSYIEYNSKEHRDEVNAKVMAEWGEKMKENPDFMKECTEMMNMQKFSTGGFTIEVSN